MYLKNISHFNGNEIIEINVLVEWKILQGDESGLQLIVVDFFKTKKL